MRRLPVILFGLTVAVAAEAPHCYRVFHPHHSKQTIDKWAEWRTHHPNWKPKITPQELCEIPLLSEEPPLWFIPDVVETQDAPLFEPPQLSPDEPPTYGIPERPYDGTYTIPRVEIPIVYTAGVMLPTPEPSSVLLVSAGVLLFLARVLSSLKRRCPDCGYYPGERTPPVSEEPK